LQRRWVGSWGRITCNQIPIRHQRLYPQKAARVCRPRAYSAASSRGQAGRWRPRRGAVATDQDPMPIPCWMF